MIYKLRLFLSKYCFGLGKRLHPDLAVLIDKIKKAEDSIGVIEVPSWTPIPQNAEIWAPRLGHFNESMETPVQEKFIERINHRTDDE